MRRWTLDLGSILPHWLDSLLQLGMILNLSYCALRAILAFLAGRSMYLASTNSNQRVVAMPLPPQLRHRHSLLTPAALQKLARHWLNWIMLGLVCGNAPFDDTWPQMICVLRHFDISVNVICQPVITMPTTPHVGTRTRTDYVHHLDDCDYLLVYVAGLNDAEF